MMLLHVAVALLLVISYADLGEGAQSSPLTQEATGEDLVRVEVATVGFDRRAGAPVVLLRDPESGTVVPILVGTAEAQAIARALRGATVPRPMTHDLMANLLSEVQARVEEVLVHAVRDNIYFGTVRLRVAGEEKVRDVDSRPSDALALALRTGAPIRVVRKMLVEPLEFDFVAPEGPDQVVQTMGITVVAPTPALRVQFNLRDRTGVLVTHVFGRAEGKGLQRGDLIVEVNGNSLQEPIDFFQAVRATPLRDSVRITYWRAGEEHKLEIPTNLPPLPRPQRDGPVAV